MTEQYYALLPIQSANYYGFGPFATREQATQFCEMYPPHAPSSMVVESLHEAELLCESISPVAPAPTE